MHALELLLDLLAFLSVHARTLEGRPPAQLRHFKIAHTQNGTQNGTHMAHTQNGTHTKCTKCIELR